MSSPSDIEILDKILEKLCPNCGKPLDPEWHFCMVVSGKGNPTVGEVFTFYYDEV